MKRIIFLSAFILLAPTLIYAQTIFPNRGGTGTTTIPTTGQVLVGQSNGTYAPQATATLGISGGSGGFGTTSIDTESELESILTDVTNVFTNNDGSLSDDNLSNNTTSDLLEGTNLYYTVGRVQTALTAGYNAIFGNSTTTNATTTNLAVTGAFNFLGTVVTNVSTWFNGLFNTQFATKTTDNLAEGTTNKYNKISTSTTPTGGHLSYWTGNNTLGSVATGTLTETATGLQFDNTRGLVGGSAILSLTAGYSIPLTASTTDWQTAFGWGNHASQGYLSTTSGNWVGTVDGNNFAGGAISSGDMLYGSGAGAISELAIGASSTLLVSNGSTPFWITGPSICTAITGGSALCDGDDATGAGGGITTLNTLINSTQTFAVGTSSNIGIGIVSSGSTHTFTPTLASGFSVPSTSDFTNWNTAFSWGNHASVGYLSTTSGNWLGTFDGQEGSYYLSRANHTGTQSSTTITGLGTLAGLNSVDISANTNLTAGDALTLTDDDIDFDGGATPQGELGGTWASPTIDDSLAVTSWNLTTPTLTSFFGTPCTGNQFLQDIGDSGAFTCVTASGGLATTSPWTAGNLAYVTGQGSVGSVATGTLTETVSGLELNATRALIGGSAILAITSGYEVPLTASTSNWQIAFASTTAMTPTYTRSLFSNTATGLTYTSATGLTALTAGYNIPLSASTTEWANFYATPSTRITAGANCSWAGNTFDCSGGSGGGGALSTTTDIIGVPTTAAELVSYVTGDVMFGGSASTSAEFQLDDDGAQLIISSTTNSNATATIESGNSAMAVRIGDDSGVGIEHIFSTAGEIISQFYGSVTEWIMNVAKVAITGKLYVATTTYNGATTTDALVIDGYTNSGEWMEEFCTTAGLESTQIAADTVRGCNRFTYIEDAAGVIDFVVPTTATSSYFRIRVGATGTTNAAGDGMGIGSAGGVLDAGDIQLRSPAMEWAWRTDAMGNATSSMMIGGIADKYTVTTDFSTEPTEGFYVMASSTSANWQFACNPSTGATTYTNTNIATTTVTSVSATTNNPFVHWRLEIGGTSNTAVTAVLKARTVSNQNFTQVGACTINVSASTNLLAPVIGSGRTAAGTLSPELHVMFLKFWYKQRVF